jgi:hypothetical protein
VSSGSDLAGYRLGHSRLEAAQGFRHQEIQLGGDGQGGSDVDRQPRGGYFKKSTGSGTIVARPENQIVGIHDPAKSANKRITGEFS